MRLRTLLHGTLLFTFACARVLAQVDADPCHADDPFQIQERLAAGNSSMLCRGIEDASFGRQARAERELRWVIRRIPRSGDSYRAHEALTWTYFRTGRYRGANAQLEQMMAEKSDAEDLKSVHSLFAALAQYPDQKVVRRGPSELRSETIENNLFLPITVNGVSASYIADTGANISVLSESEARRVGLKVKETTTRMSDINGALSSITMRVADASDVWIGKTHLKHVSFDVFPDANEPFVDLPQAHKGVIGISVLIALGAFRVDSENRVEILPGPASAIAANLPLAFDSAYPVTRMQLNGKWLSFTLDTGADRTYLYPPFAAEFPDLMREGSKQDRTVTGFSGSKVQASEVLPSVRFSLGREVKLDQATVFLKNTSDASAWAAGNLGFDLISQAIPVTIDFNSMQLHVETR